MILSDNSIATNDVSKVPCPGGALSLPRAHSTVSHQSQINVSNLLTFMDVHPKIKLGKEQLPKRHLRSVCGAQVMFSDT